MRNVFDQYSQSENRLTHAFFTALDKDRKLLASFLNFLGISAPKRSSKLGISVQKYPFEAELTETELQKRGIPDAWIFDEDWAVVFEVKITASLAISQIRRHRQSAVKRGFDNHHMVAIVAKPVSLNDEQCAIVHWKDVYRWLKFHSANEWAKTASDYFEILEAQMNENSTLGDAALTSFASFFKKSSDYNYGEAKRLLRLSMAELRKSSQLISHLDVDPIAKGRSSITGKDSSSVWDYLQLNSDGDSTGFTSHPHLTLGISAEHVEATVTFPHRLATHSKNALKQLGKNGFETKCMETLSHLETGLKSEPFAKPFMRGIQRRYPSQRAKPFIDALIEFDLRTVNGSVDGPKEQHQWLNALYGSFVDRKSNYQIQIGAAFPYDRCQSMAAPAALELIENTWLACKPILDIAR